jgi:hypothetical protein
MIDVEPLIVSELERILPLPDGRRVDWQDVVRRAGSPSSQGDWFGRRPRLTRRRVVAAVVIVVLALALPALALSGVLDPVFGISNHGKPTHATAFNRQELNDRLFKKLGLPVGPTTVADPDTLVRLASREGIGVYAARSKKGNRRCYYTGQYYPKPDPHPHRLHLGGGCGPYGFSFALPERLMRVSGQKGTRQQNIWLRTHPFPSPARPILVLSESPFVGVAANGVRSIQLLALSDCHPLVTVPVIDNTFIDAHPPTAAAAFLVARDASGRIIWHSAKSDLTNQYQRVPTNPTMPKNCGLR